MAAVPELGAETRKALDGLGRAGLSVTEVEDLDGPWSLSEVHEKLLAGSLDLGLVPFSVHIDGLETVAVLERDEPRDVVVSNANGSGTLARLPEGTRVGLAGTRRLGLLRAHRPDLEPVSLTNGHTPATVLEEGKVDALILGASQARHLGLSERTAEFLDPKAWVPGPGQGAIVVLGRAYDETSREAGALLDVESSHCSWACELSLAQALGADSDAPLGALALPFGRWIRLWALVTSPDGSRVARADLTGSVDDPEGLGRAVADLLLMREAGPLLSDNVA